MLPIYYIFFLLSNFTVKLFEKHTNKIINVIDKNLIYNNNNNNLNIYYEKELNQKNVLFQKYKNIKYHTIYTD